jgi:acyl carrier protein
VWLDRQKQQSNNLSIGEEYLSSLRDACEVNIYGERTKDVYGCAWPIVTSMANMRGQVQVDISAVLLNMEAESISITAKFYELDGHSLLAIQVISKIRSQLAIDVPLKAWFKANTIAGVSEVIQAIKVQCKKPAVDANLTEVEFEEISL